MRLSNSGMLIMGAAGERSIESWLKVLYLKLVGGIMAKIQRGQVVWLRQQLIGESILTEGVLIGMPSLNFGQMIAGIAQYSKSVAIETTAQSNNSFNRSANSIAFMREAMLLWRFVAPG